MLRAFIHARKFPTSKIFTASGLKYPKNKGKGEYTMLGLAMECRELEVVFVKPVRVECEPPANTAMVATKAASIHQMWISSIYVGCILQIGMLHKYEVRKFIVL